MKLINMTEKQAIQQSLKHSIARAGQISNIDKKRIINQAIQNYDSGMSVAFVIACANSELIQCTKQR